MQSKDSLTALTPNRVSWSGQLAFVLAAAASAIGLGNLWRFPYLAAQYGGGTFMVVYLVLVVTLGTALMLTEIAIGRKTRRSQLSAYAALHPRFGFLGVLTTVVPILILPYYCVIGGWVLKYFVTYVQMAFRGLAPIGENAALAGAFFQGFIAAPFAPFGYGAVFVLISSAVILLGVRKGIERSNLILMPVLFALALALAVYVVALPGTGEGLKYYLVPSMDALCDASGSFAPARLAKTILGAMGQMFYSLSLAMGIMITYGSYMRKTDSIEKSVNRIWIFDSMVALLSGLVVVPVVYLFAAKTGTPIKEAMGAGPGLMFITLPQVFAMLGAAGTWIGLAFFALAIFAALTSAISMYEACVASISDFLKVNRRISASFTGVLVLLLSTFSALGYGVWKEITVGGRPFLEFFDFITNSVLMPIAAVVTCVFAGWVLKPEAIVEEVEAGGCRFRGKGLYRFAVRYFAPLFVTAVLVSEVMRFLHESFGIGNWSI